MSTTLKRDALVKHLVKTLGKHNVKEFSETLKSLDICDLTLDHDLEKVTTDGLIDSLVVLYQFGSLSKLLSIKKEIKE